MALISLRGCTLRPLRPPFSSLLRKPFNEAQRWALLRDVDFDLYPGENVLLLGPNGCGKSTLMAALAGQHAVVTGGCFESSLLSSDFKHISLSRDAAVLARARLMHEQGDENYTAAKHFAQADLPRELGVLRIQDLTIGQLRRASLIAAGDAKVYLLDELFNGVDAASRASIEADLATGIRDKGFQFVAATHRRPDVESLAPFLTHVVRFSSQQLVKTPFVLDDVFPASHSAAVSESARARVERAADLSLECRRLAASAFTDRDGFLINGVRGGLGTRDLLRVRPGEVVAVAGAAFDGALHDAVWRGQPVESVLQGATVADKRQCMGVATRAVQLALAGFHSLSAVDVVLSGLDGRIGPEGNARFTAKEIEAARAWLEALMDDGGSAVEFTSLSQGRQMACLVARAVVGLPPLVVLCAEGLDQSRKALLDFVAAAVAAAGSGVVVLADA